MSDNRGVNKHSNRGWCIDLAPGVYLRLVGLDQPGETFTIVDFTDRGLRGREWTIRFDHIDADFAEFWEEFEMLRAMRRPKPLFPEVPTGTWYHGEDGMSTWVPTGKTVEEVLARNAEAEQEQEQPKSQDIL